MSQHLNGRVHSSVARSLLPIWTGLASPHCFSLHCVSATAQTQRSAHPALPVPRSPTVNRRRPPVRRACIDRSAFTHEPRHRVNAESLSSSFSLLLPRPYAMSEEQGGASSSTAATVLTGDGPSTALAAETSATPASQDSADSKPELPWAFIECSAEILVVLIAHMLDLLCQHNDQVVLTPEALTRFHSRAPPGITVIDYLRRIVKYTNLEVSSALSRSHELTTVRKSLSSPFSPILISHARISHHSPCHPSPSIAF